jgi:putative transposase
MIRAGLNYVTWRDRKEVVADLKPIYRAVNAEQAERELTTFTAKWTRYPAVARLWRENWERVIPFFAFPREIRKVVYTTNAVESLHMSLRKVIKTRGSFPSEEAALKLLYLALRNASAKWKTVQSWREAMNCFETLWGDRIRAAQQRA